MNKVDKKTALELYRTMLTIRRFEEKLFFLFSTRAMPGSMHQYNGEEAVATGVCACLTKADYITSTHRGHGHCIAKGADVNNIMAEMFAKTTGCCKGMGGSMHIADFSVGMLGAVEVLGAYARERGAASIAARIRSRSRFSATVQATRARSMNR